MIKPLDRLGSSIQSIVFDFSITDIYSSPNRRCKLHFTNWAYNGLQMNLTVKESVISLDNYQVNGEWDVVETTAHR